LREIVQYSFKVLAVIIGPRTDGHRYYWTALGVRFAHDAASLVAAVVYLSRPSERTARRKGAGHWGIVGEKYLHLTHNPVLRSRVLGSACRDHRVVLACVVPSHHDPTTPTIADSQEVEKPS
jgi:hypothetical protein